MSHRRTEDTRAETAAVAAAALPPWSSLRPFASAAAGTADIHHISQLEQAACAWCRRQYIVFFIHRVLLYLASFASSCPCQAVGQPGVELIAWIEHDDTDDGPKGTIYHTGRAR